MPFSAYNTEVATPLAFFFFFNDTATTEIYTLSLHDALPISVTPETGLLLASFTVACKVEANALLSEALCGVPAVAVIVAAGAAVLVRAKLAAEVGRANV